MQLSRPGTVLLVAAIALAFGFFLAAQLRTQLINPSNQVAVSQALVRSAQSLEHQNDADRSQIGSLRNQVSSLETQAAASSEATRNLANQVADLRAHAGATPLHGPGVTVTIGNGRPGPGIEGETAWQLTYADVQDVSALLYQGGAEGIAVNGHRLSPLSSFQGSAGTVVIDDGPPILAPFHIVAVGDRSGMQNLLGQSSSLGDLRLRQRNFGVQFAWSGSPNLSLPAYDTSLQVNFARPA